MPVAVSRWESFGATALALLAVGLILVAIVAVVVGEPFFAGFCLILTALVIYVRETRTGAGPGG